MLKKESTYAKIIHWLVLILFTGLFAVGVSVTGWNFEVYAETVWIRGNDVISVFVGLMAVWFLLYGLSKLYDKVIFKVKPWVLTLIFALLCYGVSVLWILVSQAIPQADQLTVYKIAYEFNIGFDEPLSETSYIVFFPYQLGIVSFLRILIKLFGYKNYLPVQLVFALCSPIIVLAGSGIIRYLSTEEKYGKTNFFYVIACLLCLPMHLYTSFVYGDLPFAALSLVMVWLIYSILDKPRVYKFILLFLVSGINYLFKTNALIVVLAISIFLVINLLKKDKRIVSLIALLAMLSGVILLNKANQAIYSDYMPKEYSSLPFIASVVMGMNDDWGRAGWCNFYHQNVFVDNECDPDNTRVQCIADMKSTLGYWVKHPAYTINFFYRKINLQWNAPLYQGLVMNSTHDAENQPKLGELIYNSLDAHLGMQIFAKLYQLSLYGVIASVLWIKRKKVTELKPYIPMIVIFGSFLFSLIWESKTRYQMPAFIMMLPCFAMAIPVFLEWVKDLNQERITEYYYDPSYVRKDYYGIDLFKFFMALIVVAIHVMPQINLYGEEGEQSLGTIIEKLYDVAVPFFFMAAGFLFAERLLTASSKEDKLRTATAYLIKMVKLYVCWMILYIPFFIYYVRSNTFSAGNTVKAFLSAFFFRGNYYNAYILWYLLSTIYAMLIVIIYIKLDVKITTMAVWTVGFICLSLAWDWVILVGDPTSSAAIPYGKSFEPLLNFVSNTFASGQVIRGAFYLPFGMLLVKRNYSVKTGILAYLGGLCLLYTDVFDRTAVIIMSFGIFVIARAIRLPDKKIWKQLRNISTGVYFIHLMVWTAVYRALYGTKKFGPLVYVLVCVGSILSSAVYFAVKNRIKGKTKG